MDENFKELIEKAKEIGGDTIPDSKFVQSEKIILNVLNFKPTRHFQTKELDALLHHEHIRTSASETLIRLEDQDKIQRVGCGFYCAKPQESLLEKIKLKIQELF
jgi:hypothetical protein